MKKKIIIPLLILVLVASAGILIFVFRSTDSPKLQANEMFKSIKESDFNKVKTYTIQNQNAIPAEYYQYIDMNFIEDNDTASFITKNIIAIMIVQNTKYTAIGESITGNEAFVTVKIESPDVPAVVSDMMDGDMHIESQDEFISAFEDFIKAADKRIVEMDIPFIKNNGIWYADLDGYKVKNALTGGLFEALQIVYRGALNEMWQTFGGVAE